MKEKILAALKERFKNLGINENTLDRFATRLGSSVKDEDQVEATVEKVTFDQVLQSELDSKITDSNKKAVENATANIIADYEKEHGLEKGKPIKEPGGSADDDTLPKGVKTLIDKQQQVIDELRNDLNGFKKETTNSELKDKVVAGLREKKIPEEYFNKIPISVDSAEKVSEVTDEIAKGYNEVIQDAVNQKLVFEKPQQGNVGEVDDKEFTEFLDEEFPIKKD